MNSIAKMQRHYVYTVYIQHFINILFSLNTSKRKSFRKEDSFILSIQPDSIILIRNSFFIKIRQLFLILSFWQKNMFKDTSIISFRFLSRRSFQRGKKTGSMSFKKRTHYNLCDHKYKPNDNRHKFHFFPLYHASRFLNNSKNFPPWYLLYIPRLQFHYTTWESRLHREPEYSKERKPKKKYWTDSSVVFRLHLKSYRSNRKNFKVLWRTGINFRVQLNQHNNRHQVIRSESTSLNHLHKPHSIRLLVIRRLLHSIR